MVLITALMFVHGGCATPKQRTNLARQVDTLRAANEELERSMAQRDADISHLGKQVQTLQQLGIDRPFAAFAPVMIEIAGHSGGADYDGQPGDDGINVYLRLRDADGDVVKAPGQIRVSLLDASNVESPRTIGTFQFTDLSEVRKLWYGRFGTYHYTIKCPFPRDVKLPESRELIVIAEFVDYLTGATFLSNEKVRFSVQTVGRAP
jgi:hypothetical protein